MRFYVFSEGFGVMAESEEDARTAARAQWSEHFIGKFDEGEAVLMVVEANTLLPFFC